MANYDPKLNNFIAGGVFCTGLNSIKTSQKEATRSVKIDADGENFTFVKNNDLQSTITINIAKNSISVPLLNSMIQTSELTGTPFAISIVDLNTAGTQFAGDCMCEKNPDIELAKEGPNVDYTFIAVKINNGTVSF